MLFDFLGTRWQRSHRAPVTDDDFTIWVMCHCVRADLDVTKSDHNWDTTLTQPRKDDHQKRDTDVWMMRRWCVSHWGSHLTGLAALNEGAFHVLQPEERYFWTYGRLGRNERAKTEKTEMFEEEEDFWSLITWTVLEVRPEKDKCKLRKIDGRKAHHNRIFHKFTAPFLDFFQLAIFRRRSHKFSTCASSHSWLLHTSSFQPFVDNVRRKFFPTCNCWREKLLDSSGGLDCKYFYRMEGKCPFENILEIENILVAKLKNTFAEEMRFFKPSTLLLKCLAWSSRLAVWSWVSVSRSMTGSLGWVPTSNRQ